MFFQKKKKKLEVVKEPKQKKEVVYTELQMLKFTMWIMICGMILLAMISYLSGQVITLTKVVNDLRDRDQIIITNFSETQSGELKTQVEIEKSAYNISDEERELLARLLYCEGRGEGLECQMGIISVVFNRLDSGYWGNTIKDVVYATGQFEPVSMGLIEKAKPTQTQYDIVDHISQHGVTLPSWVIFFRAGYHFSWKGYTQYCQLSNTYFGGYQK